MKLNQLLSAPPNPAIVTKAGARRLPRWALVVIMGAYVLAGFVGRSAWKSQDIVSTGLMQALARGDTSWWHPSLLPGLAPESLALLPYWLGAWAIAALGSLVGVEAAARIPFILMLAGTFALTWFGTYYLAANRSAQPVTFAFGGEASPKSYARAIADGGVLALVASLGLTQIGHEVGLVGAQLFFVAMLFASVSALRYRQAWPMVGLALSVLGLNLSAAPVVATLLCFLGALWMWLSKDQETTSFAQTSDATARPLWATLRAKAAWVLLVGIAGAVLAQLLGVYSWSLTGPTWEWAELKRLGRLFLWFLWPVFPMVAVTVWQWRRQLTAPHLFWPLAVVAVAVGQVLLTHGSDTALVIGLPAFAALAAFSLPTLSRGMSALVDWLTLAFFSTAGLVVWVMWVAMLTGWPRQPAANVKRLVPGFELSFSAWTFGAALLATVAWLALVRWRTSRHRSAIWKSLVLPAGGTVWAWVLLMTLWLPVFDYARSYAPQMQKINTALPATACLHTEGLSSAQVAALRLHGPWALEPLDARVRPHCDWLVSSTQAMHFWPSGLKDEWQIHQTVQRPSDDNEALVILKRKP